MHFLAQRNIFGNGLLASEPMQNLFRVHGEIYRPNDYKIEIIVLLQIQFYNIFTNVLSNIFKRFH